MLITMLHLFRQHRDKVRSVDLMSCLICLQDRFSEAYLHRFPVRCCLPSNQLSAVSWFKCRLQLGMSTLCRNEGGCLGWRRRNYSERCLASVRRLLGYRETSSIYETSLSIFVGQAAITSGVLLSYRVVTSNTRKTVDGGAKSSGWINISYLVWNEHQTLPASRFVVKVYPLSPCIKFCSGDEWLLLNLNLKITESARLLWNINKW